MALDEQVAFFIAKHIRSNVRELRRWPEARASPTLAFTMSPSHRSRQRGTARPAGRQSRQISIENIQKTVADYYKIKVSDMHPRSARASWRDHGRWRWRWPRS